MVWVESLSSYRLLKSAKPYFQDEEHRYASTEPLLDMAKSAWIIILSQALFFRVFVLQIPFPFWAPTRLKTQTQDYEFDELPKTAEPTVLVNSAGFVYEINAIRSAILNGDLSVDSEFVIYIRR